MQHLNGKNILLTRTESQNKITADLVTSFHANPILFPCTNIKPLTETIEQAWKDLDNLSSNTDIIFSSRNGVKAVADSVQNFAQTLDKPRVVAVGKKTAAELEEHGVATSWMPIQASQRGLIADYSKHGLPQQAVFFRAEIGSNALFDFFKNQGIQTRLVTAYKASLNHEKDSDVIQQLQEGSIDAVLLGSARTAEFYVEKLGDLSLANRPVVVAMSPQVTKATDKIGLKVQVIANKPSFKAMLQALDNYFASQD